MSICVSVCVQDNSKNDGSFNLELEHILVYGNISARFNIGHCLTKEVQIKYVSSYDNIIQNLFMLSCLSDFVSCSKSLRVYDVGKLKFSMFTHLTIEKHWAICRDKVTNLKIIMV